MSRLCAAKLVPSSSSTALMLLRKQSSPRFPPTLVARGDCVLIALRAAFGSLLRPGRSVASGLSVGHGEARLTASPGDLSGAVADLGVAAALRPPNSKNDVHGVLC